MRRMAGLLLWSVVTAGGCGMGAPPVQSDSSQLASDATGSDGGVTQGDSTGASDTSGANDAQAGGGDVTDTSSPQVDVGEVDIGAADTATLDASKPDVPTVDAAQLDAVPNDTSSGDGQVADTTKPDTGMADVGVADTSTPDTTEPDSGNPDTSVTDTGVTDAGANDAASLDIVSADTSKPDSSKPDAGPALPGGLGASPCKLPGELPVAGAIELVNPFPKLSKTFGPLTFLTHPHDDSDRIVVVERKGVVWAFANDPKVSQKTKVLDISPKVATISEGGLLSVAFHPNFEANGRLFLSYTSYVGGKFSSIFSEIQVDPKTLIAKLPTEKVLLVIPQPFSNHDGGQILFDKSGMLVIGMGDGGSGGDPLNSGQTPSTLLGAVLRIDVDTVPAGKKYGIPKDNPKKAGWAPELWAMGVRNPWRMSIDRKTGVLWAGDVGQNKWEEVTHVPKGGNLGWRTMEGTHCYNPSPCNKSGLVMPVFEYSHNLGLSITGGYVYRGTKHPSLQGMYLFGDYVTKRYWAVWKEAGVWKSKVMLNKSWMSPASFGEDESGEVYVLSITGAQKIAKIQPKKTSITGPKAPEKLSQTGCFTNLKTLATAPGVVPYGVNAPLWSDGAAKARWVVLPKSTMGAGPAKATLSKDDYAPMQFPEGTILIKHFGLGTGAPGTSKSTPVETRFMVKGKAGWVFWTYTWNAQGTDATLKLDGAEKSYTVAGANKKQLWPQPATTACLACHTNDGAAAPLGVTTAQLNGTFNYGPGNQLNQLQVWQIGGLLTNSVQAPAAMPIQPWPALQGLSAKARDTHARAYLDVNCATCHKPGSSAQTDLDLRMTTPLSATKTCNVTPGFGTNGAGGAKILIPGKPTLSVLHTRMAAKPGSEWFMPHLGVSLPHTHGIDLIKMWIQGLSSCK